MCFLPSTRIIRADPQTGHRTNGIDLLFGDVERRPQGCPSGQACPSGNALEGGKHPRHTVSEGHGMGATAGWLVFDLGPMARLGQRLALPYLRAPMGKL
jgi:hypothetical protein